MELLPLLTKRRITIRCYQLSTVIGVLDTLSTQYDIPDGLDCGNGYIVLTLSPEYDKLTRLIAFLSTLYVDALIDYLTVYSINGYPLGGTSV